MASSATQVSPELAASRRSSPAVSVVMPVFNGERFLRAAVDSILDQSFADFEFIIVDDGSTDRTRAILNSYADARLRVESGEHAGLIAALNRGMNLASGELIARMDADDVSERERLALQVDYMSAHPDLAMVATAATIIDAAGNVIDSHAAFDPQNGLLEFVAGNPVVHGSTMLRRSCLPQPVYRTAPEDYHLWLDLLRSGQRLHCLPQPLYRFRKHSGSYSIVASTAQSAAVVDVLDWLLDHCRTDLPLSRERMLIGSGMLAGYAYRANRTDTADRAIERFRGLAAPPWTPTIAKAVERGVGFALWGGCPFSTALRLRLMQWRRRKTALQSYRELLGIIPWIRRLKSRLNARPDA